MDYWAENEPILAWQCKCLFRQVGPIPKLLNLLNASSEGLRATTQRWVVAHCVRDPLQALFPGGSYPQRFLKALISAAHKCGIEVTEEVMEAFGQSLTTPSPLPPGWRYKLYEYAPAEATLSATLDALSTLEETIVASGLQRTIGDCQHGLIAVSASNNMLEGGTGCHDWQAGFVLAEFILSNADLFKGRSCIELGCGLGVVGIALRRVGASSVLCTDGCQQTLANCERNLHMNGIRVGKHYEQEMQCHTDTNLSTNSLPSASGLGEVSLQLLRWEDGWNWKDPPAKDYETHIDIVLGADLLYDPGNIPLLIPLWKKLLVRGAATTQEPRNFVEKKQLVAYVVTKRRNEDTLKLFLETMALDNDLVMEDITAEANAHSAIGVRFCEMDDAREGILFHKIVHGG